MNMKRKNFEKLKVNDIANIIKKQLQNKLKEQNRLTCLSKPEAPTLFF